jgi:hypothetical protein
MATDISISPGLSKINSKQNNFKKPISMNPSQVQLNISVLDFNKIKKTLMYEKSENTLCALLQALRWRITKAKGTNSRRESIISFAKNDVVDVNKEKSMVLDRILINTTTKVKEYAARFINALASDYSGRSYLLESDKLVILLITALQQDTGDTVLRKNVLGALQKLSLRRKPQIIMIEQDLIRWIVETLRHEKDTLSEYSYEYATALFMNLSLRGAGKRKCEDPSVPVLKVFNELLEHENLQVRTFVNGTLYSLLSRPRLKEQARSMGMNDILNYLMENSEERFKKQIQYIIEQLNNDKLDEQEDNLSENNEDENDVDDMEDDEEIGEDEDMEDVIEDPSLPTGEDLLNKEFLLQGPDAMKQSVMIHEAMEESKILGNTSSMRERQNPDAPLNRPMTPSMLNNKKKQQEPNELESRPKIPRTPANVNPTVPRILLGDVDNNTSAMNDLIRQSFNNMTSEGDESVQSQKIFNLKSHQQQQQFLQPPPQKQTGELDQIAFESRPRVLRTPPVGGGYSNNNNMKPGAFR